MNWTRPTITSWVTDCHRQRVALLHCFQTTYATSPNLRTRYTYLCNFSHLYYITASFYGLGAAEAIPYIYGNAGPTRWRTYTSLIQRHEVTIDSDYDTVCAVVVCAATPAQHEWGRPSRSHLRPHRPALRVLCQCGTTNHDTADRISEQFLFYRGNEAIYCAKCSDDAPPCWNVSEWQRQRDESVHRNSVKIFGQHDVKIASGSCIDNVTITH